MTLEVGRRFVNGKWTTDIENEGSGGGGGFTPVGCLLARDASFDIRQDSEGGGFVLWDALYDNLWDSNPLAEIPAGLGLDFAFDGSSSLVVPTESGIWTLSYAAERAFDDTWSGSLRLGIGIDFPWVQPSAGSGTVFLAGSIATPLPAGAQITHQVTVQAEANADPYVCSQVYLWIVRNA